MDKERDEVRTRLRDAEARLTVDLERFGDWLAKKEGYGELDGLEAIQFHLMEKHHWLPSQIKSMSHEDLRFAMTKELHDRPTQRRRKS